MGDLNCIPLRVFQIDFVHNRRTVDEPLWAAVRDAGFESDRFTLRIGSKLKIDLRTPDDSNSEPSVLIYQSELCAALLAELEKRHGVALSNARLEGGA